MYNLINSSSFPLPVIFCFLIHMLGTYYIMNLTVIVIMENYIESKELSALDEIDLMKAKIVSLEASVPPDFKEASERLLNIINREDFASLMEESSSEEFESPKFNRPATPHVSNLTNPLAQEMVRGGVSERLPNLPVLASLHEPEIEDRL